VKNVDGFVGVGGGSSMDAAKIAAFLCGDTRYLFRRYRRRPMRRQQCGYCQNRRLFVRRHKVWVPTISPPSYAATLGIGSADIAALN
jgi:alcohol dehydrogenase class IV